MWNDHKRKALVTTGGTTHAGPLHKKKRRENGRKSSKVHHVELSRDHTTAEYHENCGTIDFHMRFRQGYLGPEHFETKELDYSSIQHNSWHVRYERIFRQQLLFLSRRVSEPLPEFSEFVRALSWKLLQKYAGKGDVDAS